jgi:hypothetical protein
MCSFVIDLCRICKNWRFDAVDTNWWDRIYKISCQEVLVFQIRSLLAYHIIHDIYIIQSIVIVIINCLLLLLDYYQLVHIITIQLLKPTDVVRHVEISAWGRHHLSWGNLNAAKDAFETARSLGPAQDQSLMALWPWCGGCFFFRRYETYQSQTRYIKRFREPVADISTISRPMISIYLTWKKTRNKKNC